MSLLDEYYKTFNLSGVKSKHLKNQEVYKLYQKPLKDILSQMPRMNKESITIS